MKLYTSLKGLFTNFSKLHNRFEMRWLPSPNMKYYVFSCWKMLLLQWIAYCRVKLICMHRFSIIVIFVWCNFKISWYPDNYIEREKLTARAPIGWKLEHCANFQENDRNDRNCRNRPTFRENVCFRNLRNFAKFRWFRNFGANPKYNAFKTEKMKNIHLSHFLLSYICRLEIIQCDFEFVCL